MAIPLLLIAPTAAAEPECTKYDEEMGTCLQWSEDDIDLESPTDEEGSFGDAACFDVGRAEPQPDFTHPAWGGRTDGEIRLCTTQIDGRGLRDYYWAPGPPDGTGAPVPPDPEELALEAVESLGMEPVEIGIVPDDEPGAAGYVGMPSWVWVRDPRPATMGPLTASATRGPFEVTVSAEVDRVEWDMGDGTVVTCHGPGTPYEDRFGKAESPDCGHIYRTQGDPFTVTATSHWIIEWDGLGRTGQLERELSSSTQIVVGELQVLSR